jgi:hypothetical protein
MTAQRWREEFRYRWLLVRRAYPTWKLAVLEWVRAWLLERTKQS